MKRTTMIAVCTAIVISLGAGCSSTRKALPPNATGLTVEKGATTAPKDNAKRLYYLADVDSPNAYTHPKNTGAILTLDSSDALTRQAFTYQYDPTEIKVIDFHRLRVEIVDATKTCLAGLKFRF